MTKSYAIIGTGAIGGFCAVKLQQAGFDVHCLVNRDYDHVKENGLMLIEDNQPNTVHVQVYNDMKKMPKCDVVLITLKSTANHILKNSLPNLLHKKTIVGIVQNGIGIEAEIAEFIPGDKIVGASNLLKVTKTSPGVIKHFGWDLFEWAQYYPDESHKEISADAQTISDDFSRAGLNSVAMPHLPTIRWKKLAANIPISGLAIVLDAYTNEMINNPTSFEILKRMTQEVIAAGKQCGADIPDDFYDFRLAAFEKMRKMEKNNFSMKDDFDAGNPLELHAIYENSLQTAQRNGAHMPLTEMLYLQLRYLIET